MSEEKNHAEAVRWLETARGDLATARVLLAHERYAHSCFHAQQAAEKAMKSLWHALDRDPWGHSVRKLIDDLKELHADCYARLQGMVPMAAELDRLYIPTRYPNGLPDILPDQAYFEGDAERALDIAERLIDRIEQLRGQASRPVPLGDPTEPPDAAPASDEP
jgi:HEPN domain-containing protein